MASSWWVQASILILVLSPLISGNNDRFHFNAQKSATFQTTEDDADNVAIADLAEAVVDEQGGDADLRSLDDSGSFEEPIDFDAEGAVSDTDGQFTEPTLMATDEEGGVSDDRVLVSTNVGPPPFVFEEEIAVPGVGVDLRAEADIGQQVESAGSGRRFGGIRKISRMEELANAARPITDAVQPLVDHVHNELSAENIATRFQEAGETFDQVVGPVLDFGTHLAKPVVSVGSKLAKPVVKLGAKIAKPFVKLGTKAVKAGIIKAGVVTGLGAKKVGKVIKKTAKAVKPIAAVAGVVAAPKKAAAVGAILAGNSMLPTNQQEPEAPVVEEVVAPLANADDDEEAFVEEVNDVRESPFQPISNAFQPITDAVENLGEAVRPVVDAVRNQEEATVQAISNDVANLVGPGAKAAAPVLKKKVKLAAPVVKVKAKVLAPFVKIGAKIAFLKRKKLVEPFRKGVARLRKFGNDIKKTINEAEFNVGFVNAQSISKIANGPLEWSVSVSGDSGASIGPFGGSKKLTGKESIAETLLVMDDNKNIIGVLDELGNLRELNLVDQFGNLLDASVLGGKGKVNQPERQEQSYSNSYDKHSYGGGHIYEQPLYNTQHSYEQPLYGGHNSYEQPLHSHDSYEHPMDHYQEEVLTYDQGQDYQKYSVYKAPSMSHNVYTSSYKQEPKYRPMKSYSGSSVSSDYSTPVGYGLDGHDMSYDGEHAHGGRYQARSKRTVVGEEYFMSGGSSASSVVPELVLGSIHKDYGFHSHHPGTSGAYGEVLTIIEEPAKRFKYNSRQANSLLNDQSAKLDGHSSKYMGKKKGVMSTTTSAPITTMDTTPEMPPAESSSVLDQSAVTVEGPPTTTTEPVTATMEPVTTTMEPVTTTMEPVTTTTEPTTTESTTTTMEPVTTTTEPTTTESTTTTMEPITTAMEPITTTTMEPITTTTMEPIPTTTTSAPVEPRMDPEPLEDDIEELIEEPVPMSTPLQADMEQSEPATPVNPAVASAPASPKCESELTFMKTSLCHRIEEYSIVKCDNSPSCEEMDIDLANLVDVCKTPSREQLCKMSVKTMSESQMGPSSCKQYKFTFTRLLDFSPFCRHQLECVVDDHFCIKHSKNPSKYQ